MTARMKSITKPNRSVRGIMALVFVCLLLACINGVGLAQQVDRIPQDATEFSTYLHNLNAMATEQLYMPAAASSASQEFTTQLDALRAEAFAEEFESGARIVVQDANEHVSQLDALRQLQPASLMARQSE
jgi:hypothetical protein